MNNALDFTDDLDSVFILSVNRTLHFFFGSGHLFLVESLSLVNCHSILNMSTMKKTH